MKRLETESRRTDRNTNNKQGERLREGKRNIKAKKIRKKRGMVGKENKEIPSHYPPAPPPPTHHPRSCPLTTPKTPYIPICMSSQCLVFPCPFPGFPSRLNFPILSLSLCQDSPPPSPGFPQPPLSLCRRVSAHSLLISIFTS
jgi:hypothetical protein